ncbi:Crp/Fnr family transcriptional regulator [Ancylomarina longa]|uniref:Crp/Fnr family transcriptional regulator n=2 Tax=Ancylomarina longa TaxID=2487017 RepID=A0A434AX20_9BACT|nr:Crp/Fnr family transcriptional regulator [Ancylomarina longa]
MKHESEIFNFFNSKFPFNQDGLIEFANSFVTKTYKKGAILSWTDEHVNSLRFLKEGTVREYFAKDDKEMNTNFFVKPQFITDFYSLTKLTPTKKNQECLTDVVIKEMSLETFNAFLFKYECGKQFVDEIFKELIERKENEEFKHFILTPDELYLDLLQNKPEWFQSIPLRHIATYLRMTPETLSRIRKRN